MLRDYQKRAVQSIYKSLKERKDNPCAVLPTGCHESGHPILMADFAKRPVEYIKKGESVMGPDYLPREVLEIHRGIGQMFKLTPAIGFPFKVNDDHILSLVHYLNDSVVNVKVSEYLKASDQFKDEYYLYYSIVDTETHQLKKVKTSFRVQQVKDDFHYGFHLDGDQLYLDGHYMVHHNSGKSHCIAQVIKDTVHDFKGRVLAVTHVKELVEQNLSKLQSLAPSIKLGVYSAGLNQKDTENDVIFGSIQSMAKNPKIFGHRDIVIIDEAHRLSTDPKSNYQKLIKELKEINPNIRVVGFTATPFRAKTGKLCDEANILNHECINVGISELIDEGYLCPLVSMVGRDSADTSKLHTRAGEFITSETEELMNKDELVAATCLEIVEKSKDRKVVLIFTVSINHAKNVLKILKEKHGIDARAIFGHTDNKERDQIVKDFKEQKFKYLVNVDVLTTGFDAPHVDTIAFLRPTKSVSLYVQIIGRGSRIAPGKENCLVLDFGENILRHGPINDLNIHSPKSRSGGGPRYKICPVCRYVTINATRQCKCGYEFVSYTDQIRLKASDDTIIDDEQRIVKVKEVKKIFYYVHQKRDAPDNAPKTLRVKYQIGKGIYVTEWICFEHVGYPRLKAEKWWSDRTALPFPESSAAALRVANEQYLKTPSLIEISKEPEEKYYQIDKYEFDSDDFLTFESEEPQNNNFQQPF